jgi:peptidoglycan/LPS O-acetylase OafA/YrhL
VRCEVQILHTGLAPGAVRRYLTAAIFPVYILHQTIIVVAAHALKPSHLYPPVEGVLLVLVTAATCFLSYEAIELVPQDIN